MQDLTNVNNPIARILYRYGWRHKVLFTIGIAAQALGRVPQLLPPLIVAIGFDAVIWNTQPYYLPLVPDAWLPTTRLGQFWLTVVVLGLTYPAQAFFDWIQQLASGMFTQHFLHDLRTDAYDTMQRVEMAYFDDRDTGDMMSILNNDVDQMRGFVGRSLRTAVRSSTILVLTFGYMASLNLQLAIVLLAVPIFDTVANAWFAKMVGPQHKAKREEMGQFNSRLQNNVDGVATIKAYTAESQERDAIRDRSWEYYQRAMAPVYSNMKVRPLTMLNHWLWFSVILLLGGYWVLEGPPGPFTGTLTAGALFAFLMYVREYTGPINRFTDVVDSYKSAVASSERILEVVAEADPVPEPADPVELEHIDGEVAFEEVSFSYQGTDSPVVEDLSFTAAPGEMIGIVGPTGAGKSTVLKLLMRLYEVDSGRITLDGVSTDELSLSTLRGAIGYVSQDPILFYGSIADNIGYANPDADRATIEEAARSAGAHEFIRELSDGYDTMVGDRGVQLSGGQRQRVCIARAILKDPAIVVLDEATSHVDNETEVLIQRSLAALTADRTTFAVAHRLSTVRDADRILAMADGEIVEEGSHDELLERGGLYADLWNVQVGDFDAGLTEPQTGAGGPT